MPWNCSTTSGSPPAIPDALRRRTTQLTCRGRLCDPDLVRLNRSSALTQQRSVLPRARYPTKDVAIDRHMADGRERQVSGHERLAVRRQLAQETDTDTGCLLGIVFEAVVPVGVLEPDLENEVAGERQPVAAGRQADHAVPGGVAAGAMDDHPRRHLVLLVERPQLAVVLIQEPLGRPPQRVREPRRHLDAGE